MGVDIKADMLIILIPWIWPEYHFVLVVSYFYITAVCSDMALFLRGAMPVY